MQQPLDEARDPATTAERLAELAYAHPELGALIAQHPNCYEGLREWIAQYATPGPAPAQKRGLSKPWRIVTAVAAVAVPVITVASVAIPLLASLGETESSAETVEVRGEPAASEEVEAEAEPIGEIDPPHEGDIDWLIPVSAPIETFPLDAAPGPDGYTESCSEAELDWLEKHASRGTARQSSSFSLTLHNASTEGASMPLGNIRFEGEEVPSEAIIPFECPAGGRGASGGGQPLLIGVGGEEARYGEAVGAYGEDVMPEGSPVTLNLSPGEATGVTLVRDEGVDRQRRYEGRFLADVVDGSGATVVLAEDVVFSRDAVDGFYVGYRPGNLSDEFVCKSPAFSTELDQWGYPRYEPCTLAEAAEVLREASETAG